MVGPVFVKEWKSKYFIKNKSIFIHRFTLHSFFCVFYFDLNILVADFAEWQFIGEKWLIDVRMRASDQKRISNELNYQSNLSAPL